MNTVASITPHILQIEAPADLKGLLAWVLWRFEHNPRAEKPRKVPYYVSGSRRRHAHGSPADRGALATFEVAKATAARRGFDGIGFCPLPEFGVSGLDFDNCVNGTLDPRVEALVAGTYAEYSPSGNGVHAVVRGNLGNGKSPTTEHGFGFEAFSSKGFITWTGDRLPICDLLECENTIAPVSPELLALAGERFNHHEVQGDAQPLGVASALLEEALEVLPDDLHYDDWLKVGMALHHETSGEGFELWEEWSQGSSKYSSREYNIARWDSFGRGEGPAVTVRTLVHLANQHGAKISLSAPPSASDFDSLITPQVQSKQIAQELRFRAWPALEFTQRPAPQYLIKRVLPRAQVAVLYGETASGKSFIAMDLVLAAARGLDWRAHRTRKCRVVYLAAEGAGGMRNRLTAYCQANSLKPEDLDLHVIPAAPNFMLVKDVADVAIAILAVGGADIVVVDTLSQVSPGANENAGEDMGLVLAHCHNLYRALGALILLVHHSGKDSTKGARGWSGLRAAADAELEVVRDEDQRCLRVTKMKDGDDFAEYGFRLEAMVIGEDEDGEDITSCVVVPTETAVQHRRKEPRGAMQKTLLAMLATMGGDDVPAGDLVDAVLAQTPHDPAKRDRRREYIMQALAPMCEQLQILDVAGRLSLVQS